MSGQAQRTLLLANETATLALGAALAPCLRPGMQVWLRGDLGAGKTTLVRGLLRALGHGGAVKSPTYSLVELYTLSRLYLYHFDFYRLKVATEWIEAGFADAFDGAAVCLVEWPERADGTLPAPDLEIVLEAVDDARVARIVAHGEAALRCLDCLPD